MGKNEPGATRRAVLLGGLAGGLAATIRLEPAQATPERMRAAIRNVVGEASIRKGRIELDVPPLVENGNTVALGVTVDSPMTATDYVKAIHVFNEKNRSPTSSRSILARAPAGQKFPPASVSPTPRLSRPSLR